MTAPAHVHVARRLMANIQSNAPDQEDAPMKVPASSYRDPARWQAEIDKIFLSVPLVVALSCDIRQPGDYNALQIAGRPLLVVRGDDGVARTFINMCRHRGARVVDPGCGSARRFTCPYHAWTYDPNGALVGVTGRDTFGDLDVTGLVELPTQERVGVVMAVLTPGAEIDVDAWLGEMADALALMRLDEMHRYPATTVLESPNWKVAADGYVDGYHIGYLHKQSIGVNAITNRNTFDLFGPHQRIGFASKATAELANMPEDEWVLKDRMSMVHYIFPNISMAGGLDDAPMMISRLLPGPTHDRSKTHQFHYYRQPVEGAEAMAKAEERRQMYERVVRDEDYVTGFGITGALAAFGDDHFRFGRNERGNQHLHRTIDSLVNG